jgi:NRPS condensation-like uncharacterized protein
METPLNSFQRTMLLWDDFHAYNAVHVAKWPGSLDKNRLSTVIEKCLTQKGIGLCHWTKNRSHLQYLPLQEPIHLTELPPSASFQTTLQQEMEDQINTPFPQNGPFLPFRFFVAKEPNAFWVGLAYFHAIADAAAIISLMSDIGGHYQSALDAGEISAQSANHPPSQPVPRQKWRDIFRCLLGFPGRSAVKSRCHSPALRDPTNGHNGLELFSLTPTQWSELRNCAKSWKVTLNDIFLASLFLATAPLAVDRHFQKKRKNMAVCSVVSTRHHDLSLDANDFGMALGSFLVSHSVPENISLEQLAREIQTQTLLLKSEKYYQALTVDLALARFALSFFPLDSKRKFYHKYNPTWGGVTNINMEAILDQQGGERPLDYWRSVSTGPVTPFVVSITSIASALHIGFSYRTAIFEKPTAQFVKRNLTAFLTNPKAPHHNLS